MRPRTSRWHATVGRPHRPAARWSPLAMPSVIVADQLTKWYGPRLAVDRVSLEVETGEVMGLLGPNGSGKTSILRVLAGYLRPSAGTARIAGLDVVHDSQAARARVGYVRWATSSVSSSASFRVATASASLSPRPCWAIRTS